MNCSAARRAIGAEPNALSAELEEHLRACPACEEYRREMRVLDENIRRALLLEVATTRSDSAPAPSPMRRAARMAPRRFALAASVLIAVAAGLLVWTIFPRPSLAADVVAHMVYEPEAWSLTSTVPREELKKVLDRAGVQLESLDGDVVYARTCYVQKRWVPHLVVRTESGPVTVIVLPDDPVSDSERFDENGFTGIVMPAPTGSIAVLTRGGPDPQVPAQEVLRALRWSPRKS